MLWWQPPNSKKTSTNIPIDVVVCIVCCETGHWANSCEKVYPKFKAAKEKRDNAKAAAGNGSAQQLVDDLCRQLQQYKTLAANSAANSVTGSDEGKEWEESDNEGVAALAVNDKCRFSYVSRVNPSLLTREMSENLA